MPSPRQFELVDGGVELVVSAVTLAAMQKADKPDFSLEGVVLDRRGEAQRESDEIRAGFDVYRRIREFIKAERYRDLGYDSAVAWWRGERIGEHNQVAEADRKELVQALTGAGLSIRATGAMLSISPAQAQRDKTGKNSNKATTRSGRRRKVSPHTTEAAGQAADGGETPPADRLPETAQETAADEPTTLQAPVQDPSEPPERKLTDKQRKLLLDLYDTPGHWMRMARPPG